MAKQVKQTLKEELIAFYKERGILYGEDAVTQTLEFFEPRLKKQSTPTFKIDEDLVKTFNEFWPKEKLDTGKHGRCSMSELMSSFQWFFKTNPTFTDWRIILEAADTYTRERAEDNWRYTSRSKYFIRKQLGDKSFTSNLSEYYERILNGVSEEEVNQKHSFEPKVL